MLDPQVKALLDLLVASGIPPLQTLSPAQARDAVLRRRTLTQADAPTVERVRDHAIGRDGDALRLVVREYRPTGAGTQRALPALIYLHGGGWTVGSVETYDVFCRTLSNGSGCVVLSVDYRLAPEFAFPAAYEDSLAAFRWAVHQADALGIDARRIAIGGDSAGGNLAAAACLALRTEPVQPAFQLLIYPATDQRLAAPSHQTNGQGYFLTSDLIDWFRGNYLPVPADYADWRASPLLAPSHEALPPALVLTAGYDPLRDEGLQYADALSSAGVPTEYVCFERQIHGFITMNRIISEANTGADLCAAALRRALAR
jgi:acetyl esterase